MKMFIFGRTTILKRHLQCFGQPQGPELITTDLNFCLSKYIKNDFYSGSQMLKHSAPTNHPSLIVFFPTQIFTQSLQETGLKNWPVHRAFALRSVNEASNFDLLLQDRTVFLADAVQGSVAKLKLSSSGFRAAGPLLQLKGDLVTALAVDWVSHNLYWSSIRSPQLYVTSSGGKYTLLVLQGELQETISIALHPPTGRLCFTAVSRRGSEPLPQVDCAHMDGSNRTLLWSKAKMPISLAFSDTGTALYWADTGVCINESQNEMTENFL